MAENKPGLLLDGPGLFLGEAVRRLSYEKISPPFCTNAQKNCIIELKTLSLSYFTTLPR